MIPTRDRAPTTSFKIRSSATLKRRVVRIADCGPIPAIAACPARAATRLAVMRRRHRGPPNLCCDTSNCRVMWYDKRCLAQAKKSTGGLLNLLPESRNKKTTERLPLWYHLSTVGVYWHCPHSMQLSSMWSVWPILPLHAAAGLLLWARRARNIDWLLQQWRANAGSATLSADIVAEHRLVVNDRHLDVGTSVQDRI